jgi:hypothetical protein
MDNKSGHNHKLLEIETVETQTIRQFIAYNTAFSISAAVQNFQCR